MLPEDFAFVMGAVDFARNPFRSGILANPTTRTCSD